MQGSAQRLEIIGRSIVVVRLGDVERPVTSSAKDAVSLGQWVTLPSASARQDSTRTRGRPLPSRSCLLGCRRRARSRSHRNPCPGCNRACRLQKASRRSRLSDASVIKQTARKEVDATYRAQPKFLHSCASKTTAIQMSARTQSKPRVGTRNALEPVGDVAGRGD